MNADYIIGVDIGGTNTDALLIDAHEKILCAVKVPTQEDISEGFKKALEKLFAQARLSPSAVQGLYIGTTHATNALLQKKELYKVGVIRIAGHYPETLPTAFSWPQDLKEALLVGMETVSGGYECNGTLLAPLDSEEIERAISTLLQKGAESFAVVGLFAPMNGDQEREVAYAIERIAGQGFPFSLSHEIGGVGFIERENSTLLNAALRKSMCTGFSHLESIAHQLGIRGPLMITQNDGTLFNLEQAIHYPLLTIAAGPNNSFMGGARLSGYASAIIVDIGGTSTDVGLVKNSFPLRSLRRSNIGGVALNFSMPDLLSISLGGGSLVNFQREPLVIGPESVAKKIRTEACSFGGAHLTLTDVALRLCHLSIEGAEIQRIPLNSAQAGEVFLEVMRSIDQLVFKMQGEDRHLPIVLVGGGAALLSLALLSSRHYIPPYFDVANAYGAALAEIAGTVDQVVSLKNREEALEKLCEQAKQKAIEAGANPKTLRCIDQQIIPYSYIPNQMARVIVRYCGKSR